MKSLSLGLLFLSLSASAAPVSSQLFSYTLYAKETFTASCSDVQGKVAAGGDVRLQDYMIRMSANDSGCALESARNIFFNRGKILAGNRISCTGSLNFFGNDVEKGADRPSTSNFAQLNYDLDQLSARLATLVNDGRLQQIELSIPSTSGGVITLSGSADRLLVVNVRDADVQMYGKNIVLNGGLTPNNIIWNFPNAQTIFIAYSGMAGLGIPGTVIAPYAQVTFNNALITGALWSKSVVAKADNATCRGVVGGQVNGSCLNGAIAGIGCGATAPVPTPYPTPVPTPTCQNPGQQQNPGQCPGQYPGQQQNPGQQQQFPVPHPSYPGQNQGQSQNPFPYFN